MVDLKSLPLVMSKKLKDKGHIVYIFTNYALKIIYKNEIMTVK